MHTHPVVAQNRGAKAAGRPTSPNRELLCQKMATRPTSDTDRLSLTAGRSRPTVVQCVAEPFAYTTPAGTVVHQSTQIAANALVASRFNPAEMPDA